MKFEKAMPEIALNLETKHGFNVLQCVYNFEKSKLNPAETEILKKAHYSKINMSDAIYVVDINNYIGSATKEEIRYAQEHGKEIFMHSKFNL